MRGDTILSTPTEEQIPTNEPNSVSIFETRKFKNPTTIDELKEMRTQLQKDKNLKRRVKIEYKKKVQIEAQGQTYQPPQDLKQFKILQPRNLPESDGGGNVIPAGSLPKLNDDTSTKDISDQVFVGEEKQVE